MSVYDVANLTEAKRIILTDEDSTTDQRWLAETPYLASLALTRLRVSGTFLDYGCGVGRLSKEIIERTGYPVLGVDTSPSMRAIACMYVNSPRFAVCDPYLMQSMPMCRSALAVWVLQHCDDLSGTIQSIEDRIERGGRLFVVNQLTRAIPTDDGKWFSDNLDVREALCRVFQEVEFGKLDPALTTPMIAKHAYWAVYQKEG